MLCVCVSKQAASVWHACADQYFCVCVGWSGGTAVGGEQHRTNLYTITA